MSRSQMLDFWIAVSNTSGVCLRMEPPASQAIGSLRARRGAIAAERRLLCYHAAVSLTKLPTWARRFLTPTVLFWAAVLLMPAVQEFAVDDDWAHKLMVASLLEHGRVMIWDWASAN